MFILLIFITPNIQANNFSEVYDWMYNNWLTTMSLENYRQDDNVLRWEVAKFFTKFSEIKWLTKVKSEKQCLFNDLKWYDSTLIPHIINACEYGLVNWSQWFYIPNTLLSEAEALTIIIRSMIGIQDETLSPWRSEYHRIAKQIWIIDTETVNDLWKPIKRWKIGLRLWRSNSIDIESIDLTKKEIIIDSDQTKVVVDNKSDWGNEWNIILKWVYVESKDNAFNLVAEIKNIWKWNFELDLHQSVWMMCLVPHSDDKFLFTLYSNNLNPYDDSHSYKSIFLPGEDFSLSQWLTQESFDSTKKRFSQEWVSCMINSPIPLETNFVRYYNNNNTLAIGDVNNENNVQHLETNYEDNILDNIKLINKVNDNEIYIWIPKWYADNDLLNQQYANKNSTPISIDLLIDEWKIYSPWEKIAFKVKYDWSSTLTALQFNMLSCSTCSSNINWFKDKSIDIPDTNNSYEYVWYREVPNNWISKWFLRLHVHWVKSWYSHSKTVISEEGFFMEN